MMRFVKALVLFLMLLVHTPASSQSAPALGPAELLRSLQPFMGTWAPEIPAPDNSPRAQFYAERYAPGPNSGMVWFTQGPHRTDTSRSAVPGLFYWHPATRRFHYLAINTLAGSMLFEGHLGEITDSSYELFYTVTYPAGAPGVPAGLGTNSRQYRDVHRLLDANTVELTTWILTGDGWKIFAPAGASSRFVRVPTASKP